ncbi:MAG TPA: GGDEF-domain containing protein [Treponema sp.]|nr:GGDEF-domain containing protein [Treponema sp.]
MARREPRPPTKTILKRISVFLLLLTLYAVTSAMVTIVARTPGSFSIFGAKINYSTLTGVLTSLANTFIIFLVVFFRKPGFYTTLTILMIQFPIILVGFIKIQSTRTLPGIFTNLFTIITIIIIFLNNQRIEKYQRRIREQAVTDELTGLSNRFAISERMESLIKNNESFAVVSVDLNNFTSINDTMGHEIGNEALIEVANRWKELAASRSTGTIDYVARFSGDKYALLIRKYNSTADIVKTLTAYEAVLEQKITLEDCDFFLTASYGYAEYASDATEIEELFSSADVALHEVKRQGGINRILHFTPDLVKTEHKLEIERKLRAALNNNDMLFNLQPQYDISHKLRGFEVLARMQKTDGSFISPVEFIPVAENADLIDKVDIQVFKKAACFMGEIINRTGADITLSTNISVRHLMKNNFIEEIRDVITASKIPAKQLEIEITESIMIDSAEKALQRINEIKKMGIMVAIDDFGTGYSSLSYLNRLPANMLKIDKSFIDEMNSTESAKQYVAAIISIGHIFNLKVISEGVESLDQLEVLKSIGCDYIQGFIWGKPLTPEDASKLVKA